MYIDLNMVRAGVAKHPAEWEMNGYNEIQKPPQRYGVIDRLSLMKLCGFTDSGQFAEQYRRWVEEALIEGQNHRETCWTQSILRGSGVGPS